MAEHDRVEPELQQGDGVFALYILCGLGKIHISGCEFTQEVDIALDIAVCLLFIAHQILSMSKTKYYMALREPHYADDPRKHSKNQDVEHLLKRISDCQLEQNDREQQRQKLSEQNLGMINRLPDELRKHWLTQNEKINLKSEIKLGNTVMFNHRPSALKLQQQIFFRSQYSMRIRFQERYAGSEEEYLLPEKMKEIIQTLLQQELKVNNKIRQKQIELANLHAKEHELKNKIKMQQKISSIINGKKQHFGQIVKNNNKIGVLNYNLRWQRYKNSAQDIKINPGINMQQDQFVAPLHEIIKKSKNTSIEIDALVEQLYNRDFSEDQEKRLFDFINYLCDGKIKRMLDGRSQLVRLEKTKCDRKIRALPLCPAVH